MSDTVRIWLVEREYSDKGLLTLVYATPDGERYMQSNRSSNMLRDGGITAAKEASPDQLKPVEDPDLRERYATEAARVAENNDPDEEI
ncbi:MAG: hypothetical protein ABEJ94_08305 [Halorientalis sp.]